MTAERRPRRGNRPWPRRTPRSGASPAEAPDRSAFWARSLRGWDVAFYLMSLIAAGALLTQPGTTAGLAVGLPVLAGLVVAYTLLGRTAALAGRRDLARVYLALLVVATVVIVAATPPGPLLLFIAYSQIWFFSERRRTGVLLCTVLTVGVFAAIAVRDEVRTLADVAYVGAQAGISLTFAVLLGLWVTQMAEQSEERAALVERLEATQAELARSHHAAGVTAERERMAREIHDTLAQGFTSVIMLAQTARADLDRGGAEEAAGRLTLIERTARDNLAEARALVAASAPVDLDGTTLHGALDRLARRFQEATGVVVDLVLPEGPVPVDRAGEVVLLRAAQEALSNVRRHADAGRVQLVLHAPRSSTAAVTLEVVDDGRGMGPAASEGLGLRGMRDRVTPGGGELAITSPPAGGTRLTVSLPRTGAGSVPNDGHDAHDGGGLR